jgi:hypothetical protein
MKLSIDPQHIQTVLERPDLMTRARAGALSLEEAIYLFVGLWLKHPSYIKGALVALLENLPLAERKDLN